jgi:hypothetical protein
MNTQLDLDAIAEEAVGQKRDRPPPEKEGVSPEEAVARMARSAGAQASISEKTAESVGERVGTAYSDPESIAAQTQKPRGDGKAAMRTLSEQRGAANPVLAAGRQVAQTISQQFEKQPLLMALGAFALGYVAAILLGGRRIRFAGNSLERFQITKPPQGGEHLRGFIEATVLKTITEHPQGMTTAEIVKELGSQGIGEPSIAKALGLLARAKKVRLQKREGKYIPAAAEVPTAPDQPSS